MSMNTENTQNHVLPCVFNASHWVRIPPTPPQGTQSHMVLSSFLFARFQLPMKKSLFFKLNSHSRCFMIFTEIKQQGGPIMKDRFSIDDMALITRLSTPFATISQTGFWRATSAAARGSSQQNRWMHFCRINRSCRRCAPKRTRSCMIS